MTKEELKMDAYKRMLDVESHYSDSGMIPRPVMSYYLLLSLINLGQLDGFYRNQGFVQLSESETEEGKVQYMRHGALSEFERDTIALLNSESIRREQHGLLTISRPQREIRSLA